MASRLCIIAVSLLLIKLSFTAPATNTNSSSDPNQDLLMMIFTKPQNTNDVQDAAPPGKPLDTLLAEVFDSKPPATLLVKDMPPTNTENDKLDFVFPDSPVLKNLTLPSTNTGIVEPQLNMTSNETSIIDDFNKIGLTAIRTIVG